MTARKDPAPSPPDGRSPRAPLSRRAATRLFAARVNHTLRGDIHALRSNFNLAREQLERLALPDSASAALERLEQVVARLERRALDVALITLAGSGELELNRQLERLTWVIEDAITAYRPMAADERVKLRPELTACGTAVAPLDRARIARALGELLHNAIRFSPRGGTVTVGAELVGEVARITVRDEGAGFAPGDAERVFEPYTAGKNEREGAGDGLGLGLAVARAIARAHGGDVCVVENGGPGGVIAVTLPLA